MRCRASHFLGPLPGPAFARLASAARSPSRRQAVGCFKVIHWACITSTNTQFWVNIFDSAGSTNSASAMVTVYPANSVILNLGFISGMAALAIDAPTGVPLRIDATDDPRSTNWTALVDLQLTKTPFTFIDAESSNLPVRFYRAVES